MPQYMLLIRGEDAVEYSLQEMQGIVEQYIAWARRLQSEGRMKGGDELKAGGKILKATGGGIEVQDGPYVETKETVGGYFLIEAADEAEAVEIAKACPRLRRAGGIVEVREIVDHSGSQAG